MTDYVYLENDSNEKEVRYSLASNNKEEMKNPLIVIGINPSKADKKQSDLTIDRLKTLCNKNGYDDWIMLNIFPKRAGSIEKLKGLLSDMSNEYFNNIKNINISHIKTIINSYPDSKILLAFGGGILKLKDIRVYNCYLEIFDEILKEKLENLLLIKTNSENVLTDNNMPRHIGYSDLQFKINESELISANTVSDNDSEEHQTILELINSKIKY